MPRYKLTVAYDGTDFCGWQKQEPFAPEGHVGLEGLVRPGTAGELKLEPMGVVRREGEERARLQMRTVQHVVEQAVREIVREPVQVLGASRTDAGVHAKGQVCAFTCGGSARERESDRATVERDTSTPAHEHTSTSAEEDSDARVSGASSKVVRQPHPGPPLGGEGGRGGGWPMSRGVDRLVAAVNGRLPEDVLVVGCEVVADSFDPISDCVAKGYSYTIHASRRRALWDRRFVTQVWEELDVGAMAEAAREFVGEFDFAAFAAAGHGRLTTVRRVFECSVVEEEGTKELRETGAPWPGKRIRMEVSGNGFLYNMVRIMAGTLVEVGRGRLKASDIRGVIESKDRRRAGVTMAAQGLCLEWVRY
jgi:tRNA pseudouridine38-40 synthase